MDAASWGIVLTADEPEQLVLANVGWHLATGAQEVHLYLDRPDDPVAERLSGIKGVQITFTDDAYWTRTCKTRPEAQTRRQYHNANGALARSNVGWLAHVDADEFLIQSRPLETELPVVRELECELHFPVSERFYTDTSPPKSLFDGVFRHSTVDWPDNFDSKVFGPKRKYLARGVLGHSGGKAAVPTDSDFILGIHSSHKGRKDKDHRSKRFRSTTTRVYHFDGLTPLHWLLKIAVKSMRADTGRFPKPRLNQMQDFLKHFESRETAMAYHDSLRAMSAPEMERMDAFGLLQRAPFDPAPQIEAALGFCPDLSVSAFDQALTKRYPDLCRTFLPYTV